MELLAGDPQPVDVPRDDGSTQRIFRCPTCQVAVFSQYGRPEVRFVRGGTLDQPSGVTPDVHIFTRSKLPWITLPDSVPAFDVYYDSKSPVAGRQSRAAQGDHGAGELRRLRASSTVVAAPNVAGTDQCAAWSPGRAAEAV